MQGYILTIKLLTNKEVDKIYVDKLPAIYSAVAALLDVDDVQFVQTLLTPGLFNDQQPNSPGKSK